MDMRPENANEKEAPRQRIIAAAIRLFAQKGFSATGVRELATAAEVKPSMISYYFGSKQGLLEHLLDDFFSRYLEAVREIFAVERPVEQQFREYVRLVASFFVDNPEMMRVTFLELPHDAPEIAAFKARRIKRIKNLVLTEFFPRIADQMQRPFRPEIIGPALIGMISAHFMLRPVIEKVFEMAFDADFYKDYPAFITDLFLYGVLGEPPALDEPVSE